MSRGGASPEPTPTEPSIDSITPELPTSNTITITMSTNVTMEQLIESLQVAHSGGQYYINQNDETNFSLKKTESSSIDDYIGIIDGNIIRLSAGGLGVSQITSITWLS